MTSRKQRRRRLALSWPLPGDALIEFVVRRRLGLRVALALPENVLLALMLVAGFCSGNMVIGFAYAKESAPGRLAGTTSGFTNMGVMMGPMILQPAVGWMLDRYWDGSMAAGTRMYSLDAYRAGFVLMVAWLLISLTLILFTREIHCRQAV